MLRKILLASVAVAVGYVIGVRAGFSAGVRDYIENDAQLLEQVASDSRKFDLTDRRAGGSGGGLNTASGSDCDSNHDRTYQ